MGELGGRGKGIGIIKVVEVEKGEWMKGIIGVGEFDEECYLLLRRKEGI